MDVERVVPLPTEELVARLVAAERTCYVDWLRAMEAEPGNPLRVQILEFGGATALVCGAIPAQIFNRVFGLTVAEADQIPAILRLYEEAGAEPLVDLSPTADAPFWEGPNLCLALARHGLYQGTFHQLLYGVPTADVPPPVAGIRVEEVGTEDAATFVQVYEQVWGGGAVIRVLLGRARFRCYLAFVDGEPAGLGVLHVADGVGSMANALTIPALRGRGCQSALLGRRIRDAAAAGCDLLVSQCRPGSTSQSNQLRAGLRIAGSKAWWVRLPGD